MSSARNRPLVQVVRRTFGAKLLVGAAAVAVVALAGCGPSAPPADEVERGLTQIMVAQGLSAEGAVRVAQCMTPTLLETADPDSLQRLADGRHAVVPADERAISRLEADCITSV